MRDCANIIPVSVAWTSAGFASKRGGKLTQRCATLLEEWVEQYDAENVVLVPDSDDEGHAKEKEDNRAKSRGAG